MANSPDRIYLHGPAEPWRCMCYTEDDDMAVKEAVELMEAAPGWGDYEPTGADLEAEQKLVTWITKESEA